MDKFNFTEFAAAMKTLEKKDPRESSHRDKCNPENLDRDDIPTTSKMARKLNQQSKIAVRSKPPKDRFPIESAQESVSDTDSNPGIGFLDLYRARVQCEQNGGTPSKLYEFDRLVMKAETSTDPSVVEESPKGSSSSKKNQASRSASPPPLQPPSNPTKYLGPSVPWTQSYLKMIYKSCNEVPSLSHWQVECEQDFTILETPFKRVEPSPAIRKPKRHLPDSPEEAPCKKYSKPSCKYSSRCVISDSNFARSSGKNRTKITSKQQKEIPTKPRLGSEEKIPKRFYYQKTRFEDSSQSRSLRKNAPEPPVESSKLNPSTSYYENFSEKKSDRTKSSDANLVRYSEKHRNGTSKQEEGLSTKSLRRNYPPQPLLESVERIPKRSYYPRPPVEDSHPPECVHKYVFQSRIPRRLPFKQPEELSKKLSRRSPRPEPRPMSSERIPKRCYNTMPLFQSRIPCRLPFKRPEELSKKLLRRSPRPEPRPLSSERIPKRCYNTKPLFQSRIPCRLPFKQPEELSSERIPKRCYNTKPLFEYSYQSDSVSNSEEPPDRKTEHPKGQPAKTLGRTEFQSRYPGNQIESGRRGPKQRESAGTRTIGGFVDTSDHASTSCRFKIKPEETDNKTPCPFKFNSRATSRTQLPETTCTRPTINWELFWEKPKAGQGIVLHTLYPVQNLTLSEGTDNEDEERQTQKGSGRVDSLPLWHQQNFYCSRNLKLSSLETCNIFMEVWRRKTPLAADSKAIARRFNDQMNTLKLKARDRMDFGFSSVPLFTGCGAEKVRKWAHFFAAVFDELKPLEQRLFLEYRMIEIRYMQFKFSQIFGGYYRSKTVDQRVVTNGIETCCPMGDHGCPPVTNENLLSHALSHHIDGRSVEVSEVYSGRVLLMFNPRSFNIDKNSCMAAVMYGGIRNNPKLVPETRFLPMQTKQLPYPYAKYTEHLPLFVMVCRNRRSAIEGREPVGEHDDSVTLWVLTRDIPVKIYVLMTVLNRRLDITRSCIMKVHRLHQSHDCLNFSRTKGHFMRLNEEDLCVLSSDYTEPLYVEISVKEYFERPRPRGAAHRQ